MNSLNTELCSSFLDRSKASQIIQENFFLESLKNIIKADLCRRGPIKLVLFVHPSVCLSIHL